MERNIANNIHWILELDINDGKSDNFKTLMTEMVDATQIVPRQ